MSAPAKILELVKRFEDNADDYRAPQYGETQTRIEFINPFFECLGWDIDKEDREVGWIRTDSRRIDGENFGVYAKGVKHRLRLVIHRQDANRTTVTVERRVYKEERVLFVNKEEDIKTDDRSVEKRILDDIGRSL